jgi:hypothetical protein
MNKPDVTPDCDQCGLPKTWWRNTDKYYYWICHPCKHKRFPGKTETIRNQNLKKKGVTSEWYEEVFAKQNGVCAICFKPSTETYNGKVKHLNIDHDHNCCKNGCIKCVRGLLCSNCNRALGKFDDDIIIISNAIAYLKKYDIPENGG